MKLTILSLFTATGLSKESKQPFKMVRANVLAPFDVVNTANYQRVGVGMSLLEVTVADAFMAELEAFFNFEFAQKKFPVIAQVETGLVRRGQNSETIVTEFTDDFKSKHPFFKVA